MRLSATLGGSWLQLPSSASLSLPPPPYVFVSVSVSVSVIEQRRAAAREVRDTSKVAHTTDTSKVADTTDTCKVNHLAAVTNAQ
jgi:hypothetical protein